MHGYWDLLRKNWRYFIGLLVIVEILAVLYLLIATPLYETDATIAASEFSVSYSPQPQSALGALSGLSLLGINDRPPSLFTQFLDLMTSTVVAKQLLKDPSIVGPLFPDEWNSETRQWRRPTGLLFQLKEILKAALGMQPWRVLDRFRLADYLDDHVVKLTDPNGLVKVWIRTRNPDVGNRVLQSILDDTAKTMRASVESNLDRQIAYMQKLLNSTSSIEARQAQISVATEAEKKIILIRSGSPIGAQVIEPVQTDPRPASPKAALVLGFSALVSAALYLLLIYLEDAGFIMIPSRLSKSPGAALGWANNVKRKRLN